MVAVLAMLVACGDGIQGMPDAAMPDASPPDALVFPACREFNATAINVPARVTGSLSAADVQSPTACAKVDAEYGIASAGPDSVVPLQGLVPGTAYIVQLRSPADLAFYVTTGCSTMTGPARDECALFVDATAGVEEVGRFVATTTTAFVVIDYYRSATPANQTYTLDVYTEACQEDTACTDTVCHHGRCVECSDSFDCPSTALPHCEGLTNTCAAGADACTSDDAGEPMNDGPAGAIVLVLDTNGAATVNAQTCSSPRTEADYFSFTVDAVGETWDLGLTWTGTRDLDLEVFAADGELFGLSFWEQPEVVRLTYLPIGTYYVRVTDFSSTTTTPVAYTLTAQRTQGAGCTGRADCAAEYRNQLFRGDCQAGACVAITATGVAAGGACDTADDCGNNLDCPDFYFVADADTRNVCAPYCSADSECKFALGTNYVCTTYLTTANLCVQKCTSDDQCPANPTAEPPTLPWYRLTCQLTTGRCIFQ